MTDTIDVKVDWFAFTVPITAGTKDQSPDTIAFVQNTVNLACNGLFAGFYDKCSWELQNAAGFYAVRLVDANYGLRMSWGDVNKHIYIEIPGKCCAALHDMNVLNEIVAANQLSCSRIDLAGDWLTDTEPRATIGNAYETGRRAFSQIRSHDGLTVYVGSRKSDRFMRVYRYAPPHPRSKFLRIEHEAKGDIAKSTCSAFLSAGLTATFKAACNSYTWDDTRVPDFAISEGKIPSNRAKQDRVSTMLWLLGTVAPALAKSTRDGLIDIDTFIDNEVKPLIERKD